jgi:hypothetical protein
LLPARMPTAGAMSPLWWCLRLVRPRSGGYGPEITRSSVNATFAQGLGEKCESRRAARWLESLRTRLVIEGVIPDRGVPVLVEHLKRPVEVAAGRTEMRIGTVTSSSTNSPENSENSNCCSTLVIPLYITNRRGGRTLLTVMTSLLYVSRCTCLDPSCRLGMVCRQCLN